MTAGVAGAGLAAEKALAVCWVEERQHGDQRGGSLDCIFPKRFEGPEMSPLGSGLPC